MRARVSKNRGQRDLRIIPVLRLDASVAPRDGTPPVRGDNQLPRERALVSLDADVVGLEVIGFAQRLRDVDLSTLGQQLGHGGDQQAVLDVPAKSLQPDFTRIKQRRRRPED